MKTYMLATVSVLALIGLTACGASGNSPGTQSLNHEIGTVSERPQLSAMEDDPSVADPYTCGHSGVLICHLPPGNPDNKQSLCIGAAAVPHHIAEHKRGGLGDYLGACLAANGGDGGTTTGGDTGSTTGGGTTTGGTTTGSNGDGGQIIDCTDPANHSLPVCG